MSSRVGNLIRKTAKATGETWRYEYTIFDELKRATRHVSADVASPAIFAKSYKYDALGRLRSDTVEDLTAATTGDATVYNYDGQNIVRTYVVPGNAATNEIRDARFYTGSNNTDELLGLALVDETQSAAVRPWARDPQQGVGYYAHTDHQGSVRAITDDTGAVVNQYTYGAYGNTETAVEAIPQRFRYTGREWDKDIALMHYRARIYDPNSGRFLQEDPIGFAAGDLNIYRYVGNNPLNWTDPSGKTAAEKKLVYGVGVTAVLGVAASIAWQQNIDDMANSLSGGSNPYMRDYISSVARSTISSAMRKAMSKAESTVIGNIGASLYMQFAIVAGTISYANEEAHVPPITGPEEWPAGEAPPGEGWEWRGGGEPGSREGAWWRPTPGGVREGESLHDDRTHPAGKPPHITWTDPDGKKSDNFGNGWVSQKP